MEVPGPSLEDHLVAQVRGLMSKSEAADAARNLVSFFRLLAKVDSNESERGNDHAGD